MRIPSLQLALSIIVALAATYVSARAELLDQSAPRLHVIRTYAYEAFAYAGSSVVMTRDCTEVENLGDTDTSSMRLAIGLVDATGKSVTPLLSVVVAAPLKAGLAASYCHDYGYPQQRSGAKLVGVVTYARFSDGGVWFLSPPYVGKALAQESSRVQIETTAAYLPSLECVSLKNIAAKSVRHVQIVFLHLDADVSRFR